MIKSRMQDGNGDGFAARVTADRAVLVQQIPVNPNNVPFKEVGLRHWQSGKIVDTAGSADLTVDGSVTPQEFKINLSDRHAFIHRIRLTMHDGAMKLDSNEVRRWGSAHAAGLTNGIKLQLRQQGEEFDLFTDPVQRVADLWRYADEQSVFGLTDGISAGVDTVTMSITFPEPLALEANTNDEVDLIVNDDLTGMTFFEADYYGFHINLEVE